MDVKTWIFAGILFSGVFAILVLMVADASNTYDTPGILNSEIEERYDRLSESRDLVDSFAQSVNNPEGLTVIGGIKNLFKATIGVVSASFASLSLVPAIGVNFASDFGIPSSVTTLFFFIATILITVALVFAILNAGSGGRV